MTNRDLYRYLRTFHWATVFLLLFDVYYLVFGGDYLMSIYFHESIGLLIFVFITMRLIISSYLLLISKSNKYLFNSARYKRRIFSHYLIYGSMIALCGTGFAKLNLSGYSLKFFGIFDIPKILTSDFELSSFLFFVHTYIAYSVFFLISVHIIGYFYKRWAVKIGKLYFWNL